MLLYIQWRTIGEWVVRRSALREYLNNASRDHETPKNLRALFCILGLSNGAKSRICCTLLHFETLFYRLLTVFQCGSSLYIL